MITKSAFPACLITFPYDVEGKTAPFFLASEEYIAATLPPDNYLFAWILPPTVVMGRNQVADAEVDLEFCQSEGIDVVRRKSGGGCIYADEGNIMFSLITPEGAVEPIFNDYASTVAAALTSIGVEAKVSGRNDILLANGTKVCGNAFYHLKDRNIVHGTMLYDTDYNRMTRALTPDRLKLESAGVKSVRSRTGLIKEVLEIGVYGLRSKLEHLLTNRKWELSLKDIQAIEEIERTYRTPDYLYGKKILNEKNITFSGRIEGCGRIEIHFVTQQGRVTNVSLTGDFFAHSDPDTAFRETFKGVPMQAEALAEAISICHPEKSVRGLSAESLIHLLETQLTEKYNHERKENLSL